MKSIIKILKAAGAGKGPAGAAGAGNAACY